MNRSMEVISRPFWEGTLSLRARVQGRNWLAALLIVLLMALIGLLQLEQHAIIADAQADVRELEETYANLQRESRYWQAEMARLTSIEETLHRAAPLGLYPAGEMPTIRVQPLPTPLRPPAEPAGGAREPADAQLPWWYSLVAQLETWVRQAGE